MADASQWLSTLFKFKGRLALAAARERDKWQAILMECPANIAITRGPEHVFEFANNAYMALTDNRPAVGNRLRDVLPEIVAQGLLGLTDQVYQSGKIHTNEELAAELTRPDGSKELRYFSGALIPLKNNTDEVEGLLNFQFDVTDLVQHRKQLEKAQERLAIALDAGRLGLWDWEAPDQLWLSENFGRVFGYEVTPKPWDLQLLLKHIHPEDRERVRHMYEVENITGHRLFFENEYRVFWPDGSIHWIYDCGKIQRDQSGNATRIVGSTTEITRRKQVENELIRAKEIAESANVAKSEFLAKISHEIRTPLTAIIGFAELSTRPNLSPERAKNFADGIVRNSRALKGLIDDLLDLSRIEAGRMKIHKAFFDFASLVEELEATLCPVADRKRIGLKFVTNFNADTMIETDRGRLRQILFNIIGNAVKFTHEGEVSVEAQLQQGDPGAVYSILRILVRDTGTGISIEDKERLFQPFQQASNLPEQRSEGSGLGLAISRQLAKALLGNVKLLESTPGRGSIFEISIPVQTHKEARIGSAANLEETWTRKTGSRLSGLSVLVAEDFEDVQVLLRSFLEEEDARVEIVANGKLAVEAAKRSIYDIVLMDLQMPIMDGYTATKQLRESGFMAPIIAVTAHANKPDAKDLSSSEFDAFLGKPIISELLIKTINTVVGREFE